MIIREIDRSKYQILMKTTLGIEITQMITRNTLVLKLNSTINSFKTTQLYLILMINMLKMDINHKFKTTMKYNCKIRMSQLIPCLKF